MYRKWTKPAIYWLLDSFRRIKDLHIIQSIFLNARVWSNRFPCLYKFNIAAKFYIPTYYSWLCACILFWSINPMHDLPKLISDAPMTLVIRDSPKVLYTVSSSSSNTNGQSWHRGSLNGIFGSLSVQDQRRKTHEMQREMKALLYSAEPTLPLYVWRVQRELWFRYDIPYFAL